MSRYTIHIRPADAQTPQMGWTGQALDEQEAREMAEADYRRANPKIEALRITRIGTSATTPPS